MIFLAVAFQLLLVAIDEVTVGDLFPHRLVHAVVVAAGVVDQKLLLLFQTRVGDGNSAQQSLGVGVQGMEEQLFSLCQLHDAALADDGDAVRDEPTTDRSWAMNR